MRHCDITLSAGARNIYHQLLMNSLLMDLKYKQLFAVQFAKVSHIHRGTEGQYPLCAEGGAHHC